MNIEELKQLVHSIANEKKINASDILHDIADFVRLKYGITYIEKERALIDETKNKIITRLYNTDNHTLFKKNTNQIKHFKLDMLEADFLEKALEELSQEGLVINNTDSILLTRTGILHYKEFFGEF
jgi:hypothetical protein